MKDDSERSINVPSFEISTAPIVHFHEKELWKYGQWCAVTWNYNIVILKEQKVIIKPQSFSSSSGYY